MNLTDEQREALYAALAEVGLKIEDAFGKCGIMIVARRPNSDLMGVVSNMPPWVAKQTLEYLLQQAAMNTEDRVIPMKPLKGRGDA